MIVVALDTVSSLAFEQQIRLQSMSDTLSETLKFSSQQQQVRAILVASLLFAINVKWLAHKINIRYIF